MTYPLPKPFSIPMCCDQGNTGSPGSKVLVLAVLLGQVADVDPSYPDARCTHGTEQDRYARRNRLILSCVAVAQLNGYRSGIAPDAALPGWLVAYIDLPTGQVSWHLPSYVGEWDGHDTTAKYDRIEQYMRTATGAS